MGDGEIKEEGDAIQREAKIRPFTIFSASLRDRLQASLAKKGNKKLQEDGVARGDRAAPERPADHEVIRQELITAGTVSAEVEEEGGDGGGAEQQGENHRWRA